MALRHGDVGPMMRPGFRYRALLLGLRGQDVDLDDGHFAREQLLDGRLDLDLVGVAVDGERVFAARRLVDRLLADDRAQDDLGGLQASRVDLLHRASAELLDEHLSALSTSTMFSESARMTTTVGQVAGGQL